MELRVSLHETGPIMEEKRKPKNIEKMLKSLFPWVFGILTQYDIDYHMIDCAGMTDDPKELSDMVKRFKRTFQEIEQ